MAHPRCNSLQTHRGAPPGRAAAGWPVATGERQEPFRLVDGRGLVVAVAAEFFCDLQAAGRPDSTIRSYGLDLLRWFRFLLCTCQASGCESVGSCWLSVTKPVGGPRRPLLLFRRPC